LVNISYGEIFFNIIIAPLIILIITEFINIFLIGKIKLDIDTLLILSMISAYIGTIGVAIAFFVSYTTVVLRNLELIKKLTDSGREEGVTFAPYLGFGALFYLIILESLVKLIP
jgi:cytochrome c biogenesis factor